MRWVWTAYGYFSAHSVRDGSHSHYTLVAARCPLVGVLLPEIREPRDARYAIQSRPVTLFVVITKVQNKDLVIKTVGDERMTTVRDGRHVPPHGHGRVDPRAHGGRWHLCCLW